jgi:ubiquinone/menaquinone biosynthesis C-methylase UbiE
VKLNTLDLLACPICQSGLALEAGSRNNAIETGRLTCLNCQRNFPILHGIPHFIKEEELLGLNKKFARLYDWFSLIYSAFSKIGFLFLGTTEARARSEVMDRLEPKGGKVLEVSIGPGVNLPFLLSSPEVAEIYGLDISIGQLNRCNALVHRKGWPVDLFLGNGEELPFIDNSFESVFHIGGINFFSNKQKAIVEMIRVAKPGTKIIICDENETGAQWYEKFLPGFKGAFQGKRDAIIAPVDLIPGTMLEVKLGNIWNGFMYCLEFRKPYKTV